MAVLNVCWFCFLLVFTIMSFGFQMSTIIVSTWASFNFDLNDNGEGIFGLFECRECPKYASRWSWYCFRELYGNDDYSGMEDMFHRG